MRSWPAGNLHLLILAALSPEFRARQAWDTWKANRRFEDITWQEIRLLGAIQARLPDLDPNSPLRPRIDGILKNRWVLARLKMRASAEALECLNANDIEFMVVKGAAFQAEGLRGANRQVIGDVDIMVRPADAVSTLNAVHRGGWASNTGESLEYLRQLATVRLNGNFHKGRYGNVDVHVNPFHYSRIDPHLDEALWARARPARLGSCPVLAPDPTDSVLISLAHATERTNGSWTLDVASRIGEQDIDWARLIETADRRGIVPACLAGLSYLSHRVGVEVPDSAISRLTALNVPFAQRLKYWSNVRDRRERSVMEKIGNRLADRMLRRHGFSLIVKDRSAIVVTRSTMNPRAVVKSTRSSLAVASTPGTEYSGKLHGLTGASFLILQLNFQRPRKSRRLFFDICIDGISIARLRTRSGGQKALEVVSRRFRFRLPENVAEGSSLTVSARPSRFLFPDPSEAAIAEFGPVPFQVAGIWAD